MLIGAVSDSFRARRLKNAEEGFTLIEILIVISIIALLSSLILVAVNRARLAAAEATAKMEISSLTSGLEQYVQDESDYPGAADKIDSETNQFPKLYNALFGTPRPNGPGGRSAPYTKIEEKKVCMWDDDSQTYRPSTAEERRDVKASKFLVDPWGNAYVYRANKGRKPEDFMHNEQGADIYSPGPNGIDDTAAGNSEGDDIGNW
jgi:prepilin-type N-terminal cleavage/methylation domain-containing protein